MLLKAQGIDESQPNQVIKLFGELVNQGAGDNYEMAMQVLGGEYVNSTGDTVQVVPYVSYLGQNYDDPIVIINHLEQGIPLVMATQSHGRVCVGVDYTTKRGGVSNNLFKAFGSCKSQRRNYLFHATVIIRGIYGDHDI